MRHSCADVPSQARSGNLNRCFRGFTKLILKVGPTTKSITLVVQTISVKLLHRKAGYSLRCFTSDSHGLSRANLVVRTTSIFKTSKMMLFVFFNFIPLPRPLHASLMTAQRPPRLQEACNKTILGKHGILNSQWAMTTSRHFRLVRHASHLYVITWSRDGACVQRKTHTSHDALRMPSPVVFTGSEHVSESFRSTVFRFVGPFLCLCHKLFIGPPQFVKDFKVPVIL